MTNQEFINGIDESMRLIEIGEYTHSCVVIEHNIDESCRADYGRFLGWDITRSFIEDNEFYHMTKGDRIEVRLILMELYKEYVLSEEYDA